MMIGGSGRAARRQKQGEFSMASPEYPKILGFAGSEEDHRPTEGTEMRNCVKARVTIGIAMFLATAFVARGSVAAELEDKAPPASDASKTNTEGKVQAVLPSLEPNPKVTEVLAALGDNSSAILTGLKTVGEWNKLNRDHYMDKRGPTGRNYCIKAVWMPDRKRAFFCGGNHGVPHRVNDAWEFDLPSHTWVQLFAPDPDRGRGVTVLKEFEYTGKDGKLKRKKTYATKRGGPSHLGHTWWGLAYHPGMKAAVWMNVAIDSSAAGTLKKNKVENAYMGPPMWAFYPFEKKWKPVLSDGPWPCSPFAGAMEYVPELGGLAWMTGGWNGCGVWAYSAEKNAWKGVYGDKLRSPIYESVTAYDPVNKVIVAQTPNRETYHFSLEKKTWERILNPGKTSKDHPIGFDAKTPFFYDSVSKVCLLNHGSAMWAYDAGAKKWTALKFNGPAMPNGPEKISYYDPERNVFVCNRGTKTWVYRYKRRTE
jgi:hypothetical protein